MRKTDLAYIAGVLDADGTIGIKRATYAARVIKDCKQASYTEQMEALYQKAKQLNKVGV
jgi:hypothetical protein